jgi:hypothetical protein
MIIVRPNYQPGKEVTYDLVQERTLARQMTLSDAEWLAGLVNQDAQPKSPTVDHVRATFDQALADACVRTDREKQAAVQREQKPLYPFGDVDEQRAHQTAVNAKLDGFTAEAGRPTSAPFEGVPGCGCVPCTIYWQQKDRARRNPIQYPGGKS